MAERKKQSLLTGAGVLAIATVLVKIIGAVYKIPLMSLLTPEGNGYFQGAYAIYNPNPKTPDKKLFLSCQKWIEKVLKK